MGPLQQLSWFLSYFSRNVVAVNALLLQKHVKTALILGQGVTCNSVDELLQAKSPLLDEGLLEDALITSEGQLSLQGLAWQRWYYNLTVSFQLIL